MTDTELDNLIEIAKMLQEDDDWTEAFSMWEEMFVKNGELVRILEELRDYRQGKKP